MRGASSASLAAQLGGEHSSCTASLVWPGCWELAVLLSGCLRSVLGWSLSCSVSCVYTNKLFIRALHLASFNVQSQMRALGSWGLRVGWGGCQALQGTGAAHLGIRNTGPNAAHWWTLRRCCRGRFLPSNIGEGWSELRGLHSGGRVCVPTPLKQNFVQPLMWQTSCLKLRVSNLQSHRCFVTWAVVVSSFRNSIHPFKIYWNMLASFRAINTQFIPLN